MRYLLENAVLKAEFESFGAELKSLADRKAGREYLWSGDPAYWGKTSPFLFPFIGKLEEGRFFYEGSAYRMEKHGFGQRVEYETVEWDKTHIRFRIRDTNKTYQTYPFHFQTDVEYRLSEDGLQENWYVKNTGDRTMYFSVGAHPAFACPLGGGSRLGSYVKLYGAEGQSQIFSLYLNEQGLLTGKRWALALKDGMFPITDSLFDVDTLIFEEEGITGAALCDLSGREYVRVESTAPVWGIWSHPDSRAAYICLEPWYGLCDAAGYEGGLGDRPHTNQAAPGEVWEGGIRIVISDLAQGTGG